MNVNLSKYKLNEYISASSTNSVFNTETYCEDFNRRATEFVSELIDLCKKHGVSVHVVDGEDMLSLEPLLPSSYDIVVETYADPYVIYHDFSDNIVRVEKEFFDYYTCSYGEEDLLGEALLAVCTPPHEVYESLREYESMFKLYMDAVRQFSVALFKIAYAGDVDPNMYEGSMVNSAYTTERLLGEVAFVLMGADIDISDIKRDLVRGDALYMLLNNGICASDLDALGEELVSFYRAFVSFQQRIARFLGAD